MNNTIVTPGVGTIKPDAELNVMKEEITRELTMRIIPFWKSLLDDENGGYYVINANAKYNNTTEMPGRAAF